MPVYKIHHVTRYEYDVPVRESVSEIKLVPYICAEQETLKHELIITNSPAVELYDDYWKNKTGIFNIIAPHQSLVVESKLLIRTLNMSRINVNMQDGFDALKKDIASSLQLLELSLPELINSDDIINAILQTMPTGKNVAEHVDYFSGYIFKHFKYVKDITNITTTVDDILSHKAGVCQDFAHVLLQLLRTLGIPSRYVSGYICPNKNGMRGEGATHAWVEAWLPGYGWAGIDPTNNAWVMDAHVKLAVGRHFKDCTPIKGTFKGSAIQTLSIYVSVGYEDGHIFDELNKVNMEVQSPHAEDKKKVMQDFSAQQQ
jgi:transglutaminase-like putative cysteine protease